MHITTPVTAEEYDASHHPRYAGCQHDIIYDVIFTVYQHPYTAKFVFAVVDFVMLKIIQLNEKDVES